MIKDMMVRVRLKKSHHEQRVFSFVGKVIAFSDFWVVIDGRGVMLARQQPNGAQVDTKVSRTVIPRDNIDTIRVLPDDFDLASIAISTEGQQLVMTVPGALDCFLGELGEG